MIRATKRRGWAVFIGFLWCAGRAAAFGATFTPTTPLPDPHYGHALVAMGGFLYNLGGLSGTTGAAGAVNVYVASLQSNGAVGAWAATTPLPEPVFYHSAVAANGFVYALGGWHYVNSSPVGSAAVYFAKANAGGALGAWQTGPALPQTLFFLSAAVWNGRIYVTGGWNPSGSLSSQVYSSQIQPDGSLSAWAPQAALPEGVYTHSAVANGTLYVLGGVAAGGSQIENIVYYSTINADGTLNPWSTTTPLPQALSNHAAAVANGYVIVTGGWTGSAPTGATELSPVSPNGTLGAWSGFGALPGPLYMHAEAVWNGWLYVSGGNDGQNPQSAVYDAPLPAPNDQLPPRTALALGAPKYGAPPFISPRTSMALTAVDDALVLGDGAGVGVQSTQWALDQGTFTAYAGPLTIAQDGAHWLSYFSVDKLGHSESVHVSSMAVDGTPTVSTLNVGAPQATLSSGELIVAATTPLSASAVDPMVGGVASGVAQLLVAVDSAPLAPYAGLFVLPAADGAHTVTLQSADNLGNVETAHSQRIYRDGTPPVTTLSPSSAPYVPADGVPVLGASGSLAFSAVDPLNGGVAAGVSRTEYLIDGGSWTAASAPLSLSEGTRSISYRSVDNVGNVEATRTAVYRIDLTPPQTTLRLGAAVALFGVNVVSPSTALTLSAQDPLSNGVASGVARIVFSLDGAPDQAYAAPFTLNVGSHTISYGTVDNAGNAEPRRQAALSVAPSLAPSTSPGNGEEADNDDGDDGNTCDADLDRAPRPHEAYDIDAARAWARANGSGGDLASRLSDGALVLDGDERLTISSGSYYLKGLRLSDNAGISVSGQVNLFVDGPVSIKGNATLNASGDASDLWIVVGSGDVALSKGGRAAFSIYAPDSRIGVGGLGEYAGCRRGPTVTISRRAERRSTRGLSPLVLGPGQVNHLTAAFGEAAKGTPAWLGERGAAVVSNRMDFARPLFEGFQSNATAQFLLAYQPAHSGAVVQRLAYQWRGLSLSSHSALGVVADQGGSVASPDRTSVTVPEGAASKGLSITVAQAAPADPIEEDRKQAASDSRGLTPAAPPVQFGPEGTQFAKPVTLALPYDPASLPAGASEANLLVYYWDSTHGDWEAMPSTVDPLSRLVRAQTTHFSLYQIMAGAAPRATPAVSNDVASAQIACDPLRPGCQPMRFQNLPAGARLRVYTLTGALVKDLSADGSGQAQWDGTNQSGQPVGSGLYFVFAQGAGTAKTIKVAVER